MALKDYKGIFKTDILQLKKSYNPFWDYYIFDFNINNSNWETWEHAFFISPKKLKKDRWFRPLSIASNQEEWIMRVATKINKTPSEFKKFLKNMKPWDDIKIRWPFWSFKLQDNTSAILLIAGWIGIAPIRALLNKVKNDTKREIVLLFSSNDGYIFKDEFDEIMKNNSQIKIHYLTSREELSMLTNKYSNKFQNSAYYYLSWTIPMIKSVTKNLKDNNIKNNRLFNDPFYWY